MELKRYCIVYLSEGGMHYRFRCAAKNKREAKKIFREGLGVSEKTIVEIEVEE